ncbi:threonine synthase-like 1 [Glandiceps talaboti]
MINVRIAINIANNVFKKPTFTCRMYRDCTASNRRYFAGGTSSCGPWKYDGDDNIILMGCPGSGKTTIGQMISGQMSMPAFDIDNDLLEPSWKTSVGNKLSEVGPEKFLELEGEALLQFHGKKQVVSLTGSNPMHSKSMDHISKSGLVIFLDVSIHDILERLERMKVDRIVGQKPGITMEDILKYRLQFYERWYDVRVICSKNENLDSIVRKVLKAVQNNRNKSGHISTRSLPGVTSKTSESKPKDFLQVVREGLANDGGLYTLATDVPYLDKDQWSRLIGCSYQEKAVRILEQWIHPDDLHPRKLKTMIGNSYQMKNFNCRKVIPLVHLDKNQYLLELFHGPTASFKDAALQLMPQFFQEAVTRSNDNSRYLILVATSGDTGSAVLDGFSKYTGDTGTSVMVLFPEDGVSAVQKSQMRATTGDNVQVVGVKGDFDFCQSAIKKIFSNTELTNQLQDQYNIKLSAANSINWGRLLPQVVYHASAYLDLVEQSVITMGDQIDVCIPTGNFGNILAAVYAKSMGIPIRRFICASNINNVLTEFLQTGVYNTHKRNLRLTMSPAIDILKSSNLERFLYFITNGDTQLVSHYYDLLEKDKYFQVSPQILEMIQEDFVADYCSEKECSETLQTVFKQTGYLMDPHTAVAKTVADKFNDGDCPMVITATAHYAKFASDVLNSLGQQTLTEDPATLFQQLDMLNPKPRLHQELSNVIHQSSTHKCVIEANMNDVIKEVCSFIERMS